MYLAIDLWSKRCGIAVYVEWVVIPKDIVLRSNLIKILKKYILEYNTKVIIVWLPYDLYWKNTNQLEKTRKFIQKLKEIFPLIKIESIDERYSSWEAEQTLSLLWEKSIEWKKDAISALLILEAYLKL